MRETIRENSGLLVSEWVCYYSTKILDSLKKCHINLK